MRSFLKFWFPLGAYSAIIFFLSSLPATKVVLPFTVWDKLLHVLEYAPLGLLWARALKQCRHWPYLMLWAISVLLAYLYGLTDEFHQSLTPGRESSLWDACADLIGADFGTGIYLFIQQRYQAKKEVEGHVSA